MPTKKPTSTNNIAGNCHGQNCCPYKSICAKACPAAYQFSGGCECTGFSKAKIYCGLMTRKFVK